MLGDRLAAAAVRSFRKPASRDSRNSAGGVVAVDTLFGRFRGVQRIGEVEAGP